jgi:hypothetical protein
MFCYIVRYIMRTSCPTQRIETPYHLVVIQVAANSGRRLLSTIPPPQLVPLYKLDRATYYSTRIDKRCKQIVCCIDRL